MNWSNRHRDSRDNAPDHDDFDDNALELEEQDGPLYTCKNYGECRLANRREEFAVDDPDDPVCPSCGKSEKLKEVEGEGESRGGFLKPALIAVGVLLLLGAGAFFFLPGMGKAGPEKTIVDDPGGDPGKPEDDSPKPEDVPPERPDLPRTAALRAPGDLVANATSPTTADVSWTDNSDDEGGFRIEIRTGREGWKTAGNTGKNVTQTTTTGLIPSSMVSLRVLATRGEETAPSGEISLRMPEKQDKTQPRARDHDYPRYVLTRIGAKIRMDPDPSSGIVEDNLPVFSSYPVLNKTTIDEEDWYEVGIKDGNVSKPIGWIKENEMMPWDNRLVLEFTNPANRKPTLFFERREHVERFLGMNSEERERSVSNLIETAKERLAGGADAPNLSEVLVAIEPKITPEIYKTQGLYVIPILESHDLSDEAWNGPLPAQLNKLAVMSKSAIKAGRARERGNLTDVPKVDLVFVVDTTGTMQPFIDSLLNVAREVVQEVGGRNQNFRFGFWGYQDDPIMKKGIQFLTKDFTKEGLQPLGEFVETLSGIKSNKLTVDEYEEDVLAGIHDALDKTAWREESIRILIHIGDAPPLPNDASLSGLDVSGVRSLADIMRIAIVSMHIKDPNRVKFHADAAAAFGELATNRGSSEPAFFAVDGGKRADFESLSRDILLEVIGSVLEAAGQSAGARKADQKVARTISSMMAGVLEDFRSGTEDSSAPEIYEAWALTRDLAPDHAEAFQVGVLLNRDQLNRMTVLLKTAINAVKGGKAEAAGLLTSIMQATGWTVLDPNELEKGNLKAQDVLPFLDELPYKSSVMNLTNDLWRGMGPSERMSQMDQWERKLRFYESLWKMTDRWMKPNDSADVTEGKVTPVPLEMLP